MSCIICGGETEGNKEYCSTCYKTAIDELDRRYKERAPTPSKEEKAPSMSEPVTEDTHH